MKNRDFYRLLNFDLAATCNPNLTVGTAFERRKSVFYKNKKFKNIRPHLHVICGVFEAVRLCNAQNFHLSSNIAEIKGDWGRLKKNYFLKSMDHQLSNAVSNVSFEQKLAEISENKVCWIFMTFKTLWSDSESLL